MKIQILPLAKLTPYARNPRKNAGAAVATVKASLKEFGWQQPIVIDRENVIVVGHTRYQAALDLGWTDAPIKYADDLTPAQVKAYRLMDNKSNERAEWDFELLSLELEDLKSLDCDLELTGFDEGELSNLFNAEWVPAPIESLPEKKTEPEKVGHTIQLLDEDYEVFVQAMESLRTREDHYLSESEALLILAREHLDGC